LWKPDKPAFLPSGVWRTGGTKKYLPPRHKDTKDLINISLCLCAFVAMKKVLPQDIQISE
jgi:hypothetical protein